MGLTGYSVALTPHHHRDVMNSFSLDIFRMVRPVGEVLRPHGGRLTRG